MLFPGRLGIETYRDVIEISLHESRDSRQGSVGSLVLLRVHEPRPAEDSGGTKIVRPEPSLPCGRIGSEASTTKWRERTMK
jgi:hypothetical protein